MIRDQWVDEVHIVRDQTLRAATAMSAQGFIEASVVLKNVSERLDELLARDLRDGHCDGCGCEAKLCALYRKDKRLCCPDCDHEGRWVV